MFARSQVGFIDSRVQITIALAALVTPLNSTMLAAALPTIRSHFDVGVGALTLLVSIYLVSVAVMQPVAGQLGDVFGTRRVMIVGLVAIIICSALAAMAWSFPVLVVARALMGVASALAMPTAIAYLRKHFAETDRLGSILGINGAIISATAAIGPVVGGLLMFAGWEYVFIVNIPISLIAILLLFQLKPDGLTGQKRLALSLKSFLALLVLFVSLVTIGNAVSDGNIPLVLLALLVLAIAGLAYWMIFQKTGEGVVNLALFSKRNYLFSSIGQGLTNFILYSLLFAVPLFLIDIRDINHQVVSLLLFTIFMGSLITTPLGGILADNLGWRYPIILGGLILLVGSVLYSIIFEASLIFLLVPFSMIGIGIGLTGAARSASALEAWPATVAGSAAGTYSLSRYIGSILSTAIMAAILGVSPTANSFLIFFSVLAVVAMFNFLASFAIQNRSISSVNSVDNLTTP